MGDRYVSSSAYPYVPSDHQRPPMSKSTGVKFFMPLNNGASVQEGPNRSIFSVAKHTSFNYSPQTEQLLTDMMRESRLTWNQRSGLQSTLRKGDPLPSNPSDLYRQDMYRDRHAEKARRCGIPLMMMPSPSNFHRTLAMQQDEMRRLRGMTKGRRTYEQIKESGVLDQPSLLSQLPFGTRRTVGVDKEREKDRFAHKMATGNDLPPKPDPNALVPIVKGLNLAGGSGDAEEKEDAHDISRIANRRVLELVQEIRERIDFLEQMRRAGRDKPYKTTIISQIQDQLSQMRKISPEKTQEWVGLLHLERVDDCFCQEYNPLQGLQCMFAGG